MSRNACNVVNRSSNNPEPVNIHLYSDDNPATTTKGTGFKDRETALRTIDLVEANKAPNKRIWTINTMLHRAKSHPHQTAGMRQAIEVFEEWVALYKKRKAEAPAQPRKSKQTKIEKTPHHELKASDANSHAYDRFADPQDFLRQAREDKKFANAQLRVLAKAATTNFGEVHETAMSVVCFTSTFGGPGSHGYGSHTIEGRDHLIQIHGVDEISNIFGKRNTTADIPKKQAAQTKLPFVKLENCLNSHADEDDVSTLKNEYLELTQKDLPKLSSEHKWPLRFDHCFQRVILDNAFGSCWYEHLDQKTGAVHQLTAKQFRVAIAIAKDIAADTSGACLRKLNTLSLEWRGKKHLRE
eukprot:gene21575-25949_t